MSQWALGSLIGLMAEYVQGNTMIAHYILLREITPQGQTIQADLFRPVAIKYFVTNLLLTLELIKGKVRKLLIFLEASLQEIGILQYGFFVRINK